MERKIEVLIAESGFILVKRNATEVVYESFVSRILLVRVLQVHVSRVQIL